MQPIAATERARPASLPLILVVGDRGGTARWLELLLAPHGFAVLQAVDARHAITRARGTQPDAICIDAVLTDMSGLELCRLLRQDPRVWESTPILITTPHAPTLEQRLAAMRAGAWECIGRPMDAEELALKVGAYIRAKLDADRARAEGLLDPATGLYNRHGLARRARELGSQAFRQHAALACVAFALELEAEAAGAGDAAAGTILRCVQALKAEPRLSDAVGRLGPTEFAVIAPAADAGGAMKLAERLLRAVQGSVRAAREALPLRGIRFGYEAVTNLGDAATQPVDLLIRASAALRRGTPVRGASWIRRYDAGDSPPGV